MARVAQGPPTPKPYGALLLLCFAVVCLLASSPESEERFERVIKTSTNYKYYCTGNCGQDVITTPMGGLVLMGGGADVDEAFIWMAERSNGGDFVVVRSDDDDAYDPYIYALANGTLNSVATLVIENREGSFDPFVNDTLHAAEAIFFAGGDQWTYYANWKDTPVNDALTYLGTVKMVPMGGTSAGLAIISTWINTAQFDTTTDLTSHEALNNPYAPKVSIGSDFLGLEHIYPGISNAIFDMHFVQRNRMGRLITFMARLANDYWLAVPSPGVHGIGIDQGTAVLLYPNGTADIVAWEADSSAYFLSVTQLPEECSPEKPLTLSEVDVYRVSGNATDVFDFVLWSGIDGHGKGTSYHIKVQQAELSSTQPDGRIY